MREFLEVKKAENRIDRIRIIQTTDPVIGGQPSDSGAFNSNTPLLDLATTLKYGLEEIETLNDNTIDKSAITHELGSSKIHVISQYGLKQLLAMAVPVGIVLAYSGALPPNDDWLLARGSFDVKQYPELAKFYPDGNLADVRGTHLRFWDDGRGLDPNRALLSYQEDAMQPISGGFDSMTSSSGVTVAGSYPKGPFGEKYDSGSRNGVVSHHSSSVKQTRVNFDSSRVVRTAPENRPKNTAFNAIIKAR